MRRPVRPFVTEYRGGTRRPNGQGHGPENDVFKSELAKSEPGPSSAPTPWAPTAPSQPDYPEDGYEAALRAADALFAGNRTASPQPTPDGEAPKPGSSGRVLRVLDEAPSPEMIEMMRLEEEFAPKKRGRKPGSKNKPKVAALTAEPVAAAPPPAMVREARPLPAVTSLAAVLTEAAVAAARKPAADAPASGPRGERYAWVRTRLKPGQQWKKRLPKVAW